jgi:hypothetical protein
VIPGLVDEPFGFLDIAFGEVIIGEVKTHAGSGGDFADFFEIVIGAASEESAGKVVEGPGTAEELDGLVEVIGGFGGVSRAGTAE